MATISVTLLLAIFAFALLLSIGLVGCVLPYPGHAVILGGCGLASVIAGVFPAWYIWLILALLAAAGATADNIFAMLGSRKFGGGKAAIWGTFLGAVFGAFFFPIGLLVGPFLGAFFGEFFVARRSWAQSADAGIGALLGYLAGVLVKLLLALLMAALYTYAMWERLA